MRSSSAGVSAFVCALLLACHPVPEPTAEATRAPIDRAKATIKSPAAGAILTIPRAAMLTRAGVPGVFVVRDGRARFQMVKSGRVAGERVEILSGLHGGETLLIGDLESVHDGSPLHPLEQEGVRR